MGKRSARIDVAFVSAVAAAALAGCNASDSYRRDWQQCVNQNNVVVDDKFCEPRTGTRAGSGGGAGYGVGYYHWLYSRQPYGVGRRITNGYATPMDRSSVKRSSSSRSVSRGGFGSTSHYGVGS